MDEPIRDDELEAFRNQWRTEVAFARQGAHDRAGTAGVVLPAAPASDGAGLGGTDPGTSTSTSIRTAYDASKTPLAPAARRRLSGASVRSPERTLRAVLSTSPRPRHSDFPGGSPSSSPQSTTSSLPSVRSPPSAAHRPLAPLPAPDEGPEAALALYEQAIAAEQEHQLNEAVNLYARAFRLDDAVDRAYNRLRKQADENNASGALILQDKWPDVAGLQAQQQQQNGGADDVVREEDDLIFRFQRQYHLGPDYDPSQKEQPHLRSSLIHGGAQLHEAILAEGGAHWEPEDENEPLLLARMPDEILVVVLGKLGELGDMAGIGRFAQTCKKAFMLSVEQGVWKHLCELAYQPPLVVPPGFRTSLAVQAFDRDHRDMLLRLPRVRMDGLYISVVHYVRVGSSESLYTDPVHMITYHRLIRFLSDGTLLSLLSTEHPSTLVPLLTPSLRMQGLHHGRWRVVPPPPTTSLSSQQHAQIEVTDLGDPDELAEDDPVFLASLSARELRRRERERKLKGAAGRKYDFEMVLGLGSTSRGRWNKLTLQEYFSLNRATGEELPIKLLNQGPFYFSKVRSYHPWGDVESVKAQGADGQ